MTERVRTRRLDLGEHYKGFWIEIRDNADARADLRKQFTTLGDRARDPLVMAALFQRFSVGTNFEDEKGNPLDLTTSEGWDEMPTDVFHTISSGRQFTLERWLKH